MNDAYAQWFRASAPYIRAHRGRTFVVLLDADALASDNIVNIVHDLALLHVLGVCLVIVHGAPAMRAGPIAPEQIEAIAQSAHAARARLEALFTTGIPQSPLRNRHISLLGGNLVTVKPAGVVAGVDQHSAGRVRHVHADVIRALLKAGNVVALSVVGYSTTGAAYAIEPEPLAVAVAEELRAHKLIVYDAAANIGGASDLTTRQLRELRPGGGRGLPAKRRLDALQRAVARGVPRAHLIGFGDDGALLRELFTAEGAGTQIADGDYRLVRPAAAHDVGAIVELIRPLEQSGALVRRSRAQIEREVERFFVAELDGALTGCCALLPAGENAAELAALVGGAAVGPKLLEAAERAAEGRGIERLYALTTQAADWFLDHGFRQAGVDDLPAGRQAMYNYRRNAKVLVKELTPGRSGAGVPASEHP